MEFEEKRGNPEAFLTKEGGVQFKCERTPKGGGPHLPRKEEANPGIPGWDSLTERSRKLELTFSHFFFLV